jgi:hypothetical protein
MRKQSGDEWPRPSLPRKQSEQHGPEAPHEVRVCTDTLVHHEQPVRERVWSEGGDGESVLVHWYTVSEQGVSTPGLAVLGRAAQSNGP